MLIQRHGMISLLTMQFLLSPATAAEGAQATNEFLKINSTSATTLRGLERSHIVVVQWATDETHSASKIAIIRDANGLFAI